MALSAPVGAKPPAADGLAGKLIVGYQGWFACPGDEGPLNRWQHWFARGKADIAHTHFDMVPDVSELPAAARCETGLKARDGAEIEVFSAQNSQTVALHFAWMAQYGIDCAALQRFVLGVAPSYPTTARAAEERVLANVRAAAENSGRTFFVMYDVVGSNPSDWHQVLLDDWSALQRSGITRSAAYLRHRGRPLVAIAGIGANTRPGTPGELASVLRALHGAGGAGGATVMGVRPTNWRTLDGDAYSDPAWRDAFLELDVISPWTVGRYRDEAGYARYLADRLKPDMALAEAHGIDFVPGIFPGFSAHNLSRAQGKESPLNAIPRRGGQFLWAQAKGAVQAGARTLYAAMFDEVDEGTALFKIVASASDVPDNPPIIALDADGKSLPSDFYMRVCGEVGRLLRRERPLDDRLSLTARQANAPGHLDSH
jgi:hypothetical protein